MELFTIDLTGFDVLLYTLAIAIPVILRHGKRQQTLTLAEIQDLSYDYEPEDLNEVLESLEMRLEDIAAFNQQAAKQTRFGDALQSLVITQLEVIPTIAKPMAIAPESFITVHTPPDDQTPTDDLKSLSVRQLRALCKELGHSRYSKCNKHELILILRGQNQG